LNVTSYEFFTVLETSCILCVVCVKTLPYVLYVEQR
jgi:NAD-dependent dihydropyrimidine dehydrogenase PreA subunit